VTEQSLAALAGHDPDAARRITDLLAVYRREGIGGLRATADAMLHETSPDDDVDLIVEAVLTIAERSSRPMAARRAWETFDAAEDAGEQQQIRKGGNR
jgi:hypothetical protein